VVGLIGTLLLVVLVTSLPEARIDEPAVSPEAVGSVDTEEEQKRAVRDVPTIVTTPAEVREVVHATRSATSEEAKDLRRLALTSSDPLVIGNAVRALGRLGEFASDPNLVAPITYENIDKFAFFGEGKRVAGVEWTTSRCASVKFER